MRRVLAALLCLCLLLPLLSASSPSYAVDSYLITIAEDTVLEQVGDSDVLFCCDIVSGTPFNVAASICAEKNNFCCVGGLNTLAYMSMTYELDSSAFELADMACQAAKEAIMRFPPAEG